MSLGFGCLLDIFGLVLALAFKHGQQAGASAREHHVFHEGLGHIGLEADLQILQQIAHLLAIAQVLNGSRELAYAVGGAHGQTFEFDHGLACQRLCQRLEHFLAQIAALLFFSVFIVPGFACGTEQRVLALAHFHDLVDPVGIDIVERHVEHQVVSLFVFELGGLDAGLERHFHHLAFEDGVRIHGDAFEVAGRTLAFIFLLGGGNLGNRHGKRAGPELLARGLLHVEAHIGLVQRHAAFLVLELQAGEAARALGGLHVGGHVPDDLHAAPVHFAVLDLAAHGRRCHDVGAAAAPADLGVDFQRRAAVERGLQRRVRVFGQIEAGVNLGGMAQGERSVADLVLGGELDGLVAAVQRPDCFGGGRKSTAVIAGDLNLHAMLVPLVQAFGKALLQLAAHVIAGAQCSRHDHGDGRCNACPCFFVHS